jgi:hypothetical protein
MSVWVGVTLVLLGILVHFAAAWRHREICRRLRPTFRSDVSWAAASVWMGFALALLGAFLAAYLIYAQ